MKAKLIFDLPEEIADFENAVNASKYHTAIFEFDQDLRAKYKHQNIEIMDLEEVRNLLREHLSNWKLTIE